jgi:hypothetical protein
MSGRTSAFRRRFDEARASGALTGNIAEILQRVLAIRDAAVTRAGECKAAGNRPSAASHLRSARRYNRLACSILNEYAVSATFRFKREEA